MWQPGAASTALDSFKPMLQQIAAHSHLLANYVNRYFEDIFVHLTALYQAMANGATLYYVVGNSTFYQILVPVEQIYAHVLRQVGFQAIDIKTLRKRNSKKELFEFIITARK